MNFELNENQTMISQMVRDFSEKEIRPNLNKWDSEEIFPVETMKKMGELGLLGIFVPEEYGGAGFGYFEYATALMELGKVCGGIGLSVAAHNSLCTGHILYHGNEEQKKKILSSICKHGVKGRRRHRLVTCLVWREPTHYGRETILLMPMRVALGLLVQRITGWVAMLWDTIKKDH